MCDGCGDSLGQESQRRVLCIVDDDDDDDAKEQDCYNLPDNGFAKEWKVWCLKTKSRTANVQRATNDGRWVS